MNIKAELASVLADVSRRAARSEGAEAADLWLNVSELRALLGDPTGAAEAATRSSAASPSDFASLQRASIAGALGEAYEPTVRGAFESLDQDATAPDVRAHARAVSWVLNPGEPPGRPAGSPGVPEDPRAALFSALSETPASPPVPDANPYADSLRELVLLERGEDPTTEILLETIRAFQHAPATADGSLEHLATIPAFAEPASYLAVERALTSGAPLTSPRVIEAVERLAAFNPRAGAVAHATLLLAGRYLRQPPPVGPNPPLNDLDEADLHAVHILLNAKDSPGRADAASADGSHALLAGISICELVTPATTTFPEADPAPALRLIQAALRASPGEALSESTGMTGLADTLEDADPDLALTLKFLTALNGEDPGALAQAVSAHTHSKDPAHALIQALAWESAGDDLEAKKGYQNAAAGGLWTRPALVQARAEKSAEGWRAASLAAGTPLDQAFCIVEALRSCAEETPHETREAWMWQALLLSRRCSLAVDVLTAQTSDLGVRRRLATVRRDFSEGNAETVQRARELLLLARESPLKAAHEATRAAKENADFRPLGLALDSEAQSTHLCHEAMDLIETQLRALPPAKAAEPHALVQIQIAAEQELTLTSGAADLDAATVELWRRTIEEVSDLGVAWSLAALLHVRSPGAPATRELLSALSQRSRPRTPLWALHALRRVPSTDASPAVEVALANRATKSVDAAFHFGRAAELWRASGDEDSAREALKNALKATRFYPAQLSRFSELAAVEGLHTQAAMAQETLGKLFSSTEPLTHALIQAGKHWFNAGKWDKSVKALEQALELVRGQAATHDDAWADDIRVQLSDALLQAGKPLAAKEALAPLLKLRPGHPEALEALAEACMQDPDPRRADALWAKLAEYHGAGERERPLLARAELAQQKGDTELTQSLLRQALAESPDSSVSKTAWTECAERDEGSVPEI